MKRFITKTCLFLLPIVVLVTIAEVYLRSLPLAPRNKANFYLDNKKDIQILVLGASQNRDAVNPEFLSKITLNAASSAQDYHVSNKLLKELAPNLPKLEMVIIPCTYGHFESNPSQIKSWRNSMYRYYFNTSVSDKPTYFKDNLLYISNPAYYNTIIENYATGVIKKDYSVYYKNTDRSLFTLMDYDSITITQKEFKVVPKKAHPEYLQENVENLRQILSYCKLNNYEVLLIDTPLTERYKNKRIPEVLRRRDSVLNVLRSQYEIEFLIPANYIDFHLRDYKDYNHLGPKGAEKFTRFLQDSIMR